MCIRDRYKAQSKTSLRDETVCTEPLIGNTLPDSQATTSKQPHKPGIGEVDIYEFIIHGDPNPPDLEGVEEDQLLEIQRNIQEKLKERDTEREKNITKRMKQYEEKYDFINKALLESIAQITEMTKNDHHVHQPR